MNNDNYNQTWNINNYHKNNTIINLYQNRIKLLKKLNPISNFNRTLNYTIILNLGITISLILQPINPITLGIILSLQHGINEMIPISMLYITNKVSTSYAGYYLNKLYTNFFVKNKIKKNSTSKTTKEFMKEKVLYSISLEEKKARNEIFTKVLRELIKNNIITNASTIIDNKNFKIDYDKINDQCRNLDYLVTKKVLVDSYIELNESVPTKATTKIKNLCVFKLFPISFCFSAISSFGMMSFSSFWIYSLMLIIIEKILDNRFLQLTKDLNSNLEQTIDNVKNISGEFFIPRDLELLKRESKELTKKILEQKKIIYDYYYQFYESKLKSNPINNQGIESKVNIPTNTKVIQPVIHYSSEDESLATGKRRILSPRHQHIDTSK